MQLNQLRHIYEAEGPCATVYLEARSPSEDAEHQVRLRWDDLKSQLADAGTHEEALSALESAIITEDIGGVQAEGRVLVADRSGLLLEEHFDAAAGTGDRAVFGEPAELGAYIRERLRAVRVLVAIADQESAVLRRLVLTASDVHAEGAEEHVSGSAGESVHKPRQNALKHKQIQRTADEAAKRNLREVSERLRSVAAAWRPDVIAVAGEVQGRKLLLEELPHELKEVADELEAGGGIPSGSADEGVEHALAEELGTLARTITIERARTHTERYGEARSAGRSAEGADRVRAAARLGAVDTLLLRYDRRAEDEDELLGAAAGVDAAVGLVGTEVEGDVAAVLRYEAPVEDVTA